MSAVITAQSSSEQSVDILAETLLEQSRQELFVKTDRMFAALMIFQWVGLVVAAAVLTPKTWAGTTNSIHPHLWAAIFVGGIISLPPICLGIWRAGRTSTRMIFAAGQMLTSALLIHIGDGRIEMHFHIFGSLAFLAIYRDWRVLVPATIVVAADHILRGAFFPLSIYGIANPSPWRWVEHTYWVLFEDFVLVIACIRSDQAMRKIARQTANLHENEKELRRAIEMAEKASNSSESKSAFLANMSHEIRTPMTAILGYADLLLEPNITPSDKQDSLQVIRRNAQHLLQLVNDILDVSKIEAGKMTVEHIECDVPTLIREVVAIIRPRALEKNLEMRVVFDGAVPLSIRSDPLRTKQILTNLMGNAVKFTEKGTVTLRVGLEAAGQRNLLVFDLADTGIGMTGEQLKHLFQPFSQADETTTRRFGGTGLGLVISRRLATMLGGDVTATSTHLIGSNFRATIDAGPLDGVEMLTGMTEAKLQMNDDPCDQVTRDAKLRGRVLLAEDGPDNQVLISIYLKATGLDVRVAENGKVAVKMAKAEHFDVILMDMQMPELDGYGATSTLRERGFKTPIIALTAHAMTGDREKCIKAGCTDYLSKPVDRDQLVRLLQKYLPRGDAPAAPVPQEALPTTMKELTAQFVSRLPDRVSQLSTLLQERNLDELQCALHQLKGAGGGYGFPKITEAAAAAERKTNEILALSPGATDAGLAGIAAAIDDLLAIIRKIDGYREAKERLAVLTS
jgi:signal transduction histidine kinase/CheY-like chemotaxis protein